jgi:hypothetical protein
LKNFDFFPNVSLSTFIVDFKSEVFPFVPNFVINLTFHSNIDVVFSIFDPLIQVMPFGFEVVERTNCESLIKQPILEVPVL